MYKLVVNIVLVLVFCFTSQSPFAQEYVYRSYEITTANGLLSNRVSGIYQDADGFLWMRTLEGIGRFDGHDFKWITKSNSALRGVPKGPTNVEDAEGYFWLTDGVKVDLLHRKTLEVIALEEKFPDGIPFSNIVHQLWQGRNGGVYVKERDTERVFYYHPDSGFQLIPEFQGAIFIGDKKDGLWVSLFNGMNHKYTHDRSQRLKSFTTDHQAAWIRNYREEEDWFMYFDEGKLEVVIIEVLADGVREVLRIATPEKQPWFRQLVVYNPVEDQLLLNVPHKDHRLSIIDLENNRVVPVVSETREESNVFRYTRFIDDRGLYWQQSPRGLQVIKVNKPVFRRYARDIPARGLWANEDTLFIQNKYLPLSKPSEWKKMPGLTRIKCSWTKNLDELWVGGSDGIFELDPTNVSVKQYIPSLNEEGLWTIVQDREQRWWAGGLYTGLLLKSKTDSVLRPFQQYNEFEELRTGSTMHLLEEGPYIWAVTNTGLYLIDKEEGVLQRYYSAAEPSNFLPLDNIHYLHKDQNDEYWVATNSDGLIRFSFNWDDLTISSYQQYTTNDNLSSNILYAILEDEQERLWISTLYGITCFDKKTEDVQLFLTEGGLAEAEFNRVSYFKDKAGRMYFGSLRGVVAFHPDEVLDAEDYDATIYVSALALSDGRGIVRTQEEGTAIDKIVLQPNDRLLRLNVSMLDFFKADQLHYAYKIEGLMDEFQSMQENVLEIGGLPYGRYTLRIRGQSTDKRYTKEDLVLPLRVLRPFYYQWWFVLFVTLAITLGIVQFYFWRVGLLSKRKRQLEVLVKERTEQIEKDKTIISAQATQLKELDEVKSRFFANISHELRTPLTLILSPLEGVLKQSQTDASVYPRLQLMQQNGQRLLKRINELLDLSSLDADRLGIQENSVALYSMLEHSITDFRSMAKQRSISLHLDYRLTKDLVLLLDQDKVEKIISNFLSNAVKYTKKGGRVVLRAEEHKGKLQLSVSDTGIGIAPQDLERIFERFYQVSRSGQQNGSGIGLALCNELARILGGKVWAESELGTGSVFYLQLPIVESSEIPHDVVSNSGLATNGQPGIQESFGKSMSTIISNRPTILVVEDNVDLRAYLELILRKNYQVVAVEHGAVALEYLKHREQPALIVSDIMMPVMDGIALLRTVKQSERWRAIPMIMLTASQRPEVKLEALRIGVDDYLVKPFKEEELLVRIKSLLRNYRTSTADESTAKAVTANDLRWLENLERILQDHLSSPTFKLTEAASAMNISYRRLQQKLKALTGMTPKQYQRTIKLAKARELLKSGQFETVTEVMYQLGFDNLHYFSKLYKEEFGIKPIEEL